MLSECFLAISCYFYTSKYPKKSTTATPLKVWMSLIRLFSTRFLGELTEVVSQKLAQLKKLVSKIITALIVIMINYTGRQLNKGTVAMAQLAIMMIQAIRGIN